MNLFNILTIKIFSLYVSLVCLSNVRKRWAGSKVAQSWFISHCYHEEKNPQNY